MPDFIFPASAKGRRTALERVNIGDAEFIHKLRTDVEKSRYLNPTLGTVDDQRRYIAQIQKDDSQAYYKIVVHGAQRVGVLRIYDIRQESFSWGSWIVQDDRPKYTALESAFAVYAIGFDYMKFESCHFEVRRENLKVCAFHEKLGAEMYEESENDIFYNFSKQAWKHCREKYPAFLPDDQFLFL